MSADLALELKDVVFRKGYAVAQGQDMDLED